MPFVAHAAGLALEASSLCEFTTTATGCAELTVTSHCAPSASPGSTFASPNFYCPDAIARLARVRDDERCLDSRRPAKRLGHVRQVDRLRRGIGPPGRATRTTGRGGSTEVPRTARHSFDGGRREVCIAISVERPRGQRA